MPGCACHRARDLLLQLKWLVLPNDLDVPGQIDSGRSGTCGGVDGEVDRVIRNAFGIRHSQVEVRQGSLD